MLLLCAPGRAASRPPTATATVTVSAHVEKFVYVTGMAVGPTAIALPPDAAKGQDEPVTMTFLLPVFIPSSLLAPDRLTVNATHLTPLGAPATQAAYSPAASSTSSPLLLGTSVMLRFARADVVALLGSQAGQRQIQLDLPLTSGHEVTCFGVVEITSSTPR